MRICWCVLLACLSSAYVRDASASPPAHAGLLQPTALTVDFQVNPVGAGAEPVFGWKLKAVSATVRGLLQSGYRIRLATSRVGLQRAKTLLWDSGRISENKMWQLPYGGPELHSATTYYWQVQVFNNLSGGPPGPWSAVAQFTTGLFRSADWKAHWIAAASDTDALNAAGHQLPSDPPPLPVFRHEFAVEKPVAHALLFVSGLGQYELHLNGQNVTNTVLNPGWSDYRKTVYYDTYDVTGMLRRGANAFGMLVGNGMYNVQDVKGHYGKLSASFGAPKCLLQLQLQFVDGSEQTIVSDGQWQIHAGPVLYSSTYGGEIFDGAALPAGWDRPGYRAAGWSAVREVEGPGGALVAERAAPMVIAHSFRPVAVTHPKPGTTVYDLGQNMSGWPEMIVHGPPHASVRMLAGELLNPDGTVTQKSAHAFAADPVLFTYRLRGGREPERWHPRFSYYSFRYVEVTTTPAPNNPASVSLLGMTGQFVHAHVDTVGEFNSSNALFQRIHKLIDMAVLSNLASVVTDCPSREKLGWLEQTYLNASTLMLNDDVTPLYEKMARDMRDSQLGNGLVPSISPEYIAFVDNTGKSNDFRDSPEWGSAVILSPWALYTYTGDTRPLEADYDAMRRYIDHLSSRASDGLLAYGLGDWYDIGPREPGPSQLTSTAVTASGTFYEDLVTMSRIAGLLHHPKDVTRYAQQTTAVRDAYNARLFHPGTGTYDTGSQTAQAVPLALGMVPPDKVQAVLANLVADIQSHHNHVTAGDVGFHYVVRALTDYGRSDVLAAMFGRTDAPSYGYQLAKGATTLTEAWDANPNDSQNHFMLGHGEEWFYRGLAGLRVDMERGPDAAVLLKPSFLEGITRASASYVAPMGAYSLAWSRSGSEDSIDVVVPAGGVASLELPSGRAWREGEKYVQTTLGTFSVPGISHSATESGAPRLKLGSGTYHFTAPHTVRH